MYFIKVYLKIKIVQKKKEFLCLLYQNLKTKNLKTKDF